VRAAHLGKIIHRQVGDGIGVGLAQRLVFGQDLLPVVLMRLHELCQHAAILEAAVHALPEKGHNGMGGIADQAQTGIFPDPGKAFHRHQR
jgi:hypothetical protein